MSIARALKYPDTISRCCSLLVTVGWLLVLAVASADASHLIRYQGQAVDSQQVPLEGPYTLTFRLYDAQTAGTKVWEEAQPNVPLQGGHFSVLLGQVTPLNGMNWSLPCWLSVQVGTDPELAPRQQITSVPLALRAETAEGLANGERGVKVFNDAHQVIAHATDTVVAFNTERWDTDGDHDMTTSTRLVAKIPGKYLIVAHLGIWGLNRSGFRQAYILLNSSKILATDLVMPVTIPSQGTVLSITTMHELKANDYLELRALQTSGESQVIIGDGSDYSPMFSMMKLQ